MNQLYDIMYEFNFSLPPDYALVIRALGSLEGTAKVLDPDFKVVESAYPFVIARLLEDPDPEMRRILRELLICNDGSIRWNRLERLVGFISHLFEYFCPFHLECICCLIANNYFSVNLTSLFSRRRILPIRWITEVILLVIFIMPDCFLCSILFRILHPEYSIII